MLSSFQKRLANQLDTPVGGEMLQGITSAEALGAEIVLADLRKELPVIGQILVHERDRYLVTKIKGAPGDRKIAVLGGVLSNFIVNTDLIRQLFS